MGKGIPIYSLNSTTQKGWNISKYTELVNPDLIFKAVHRDDHYIFVFQRRGRSQVMLDFDILEINDCAVLCIMPGQAHQGILADNVDAYFFAVDPELVKNSYRSFFEQQFSLNKLANLSKEESQTLTQLIDLLSKVSNQTDERIALGEVCRSLIDAYIGLIMNVFKKRSMPESLRLSRTSLITSQFKSLLLQWFKVMKTPSSYAKLLNISPSYLNEAVKKTTGFPASYWINQQIILEAKRILFHTDSSVKELASELGYKDYSYFTRVFTKIARLSPVAFRQRSTANSPKDTLIYPLFFVIFSCCFVSSK